MQPCPKGITRNGQIEYLSDVIGSFRRRRRSRQGNPVIEVLVTGLRLKPERRQQWRRSNIETQQFVQF